MKPHFFFRGRLSREESASAFLATLLKWRRDFRSFLFRAAEIEEPQGDCDVSTENKDVDIRLDYCGAGTVVLIENKVRPGAIQVNQLVRYYQKVRDDRPEHRVICILVVPEEAAGGGEIDRLVKHADFRRGTDVPGRVSWRKLREFCDELNQDDGDAEFVRGGFESVLSIVDDAAKKKYPLEGGREIACDISKAVWRALEQEFPDVQLGFWRGKDGFQAYSVGTDMTVYVELTFRAEDEAPYHPLEIPDREHVTALLRTQFKLSAKGKRNLPLRKRWEQFCRSSEYEVPGAGLHRLQQGGWFKMEIEECGDADRIQQRLTDLGRAVIKWLYLQGLPPSATPPS